MLNKSLLFSRLSESLHFLIGKDRSPWKGLSWWTCHCLSSVAIKKANAQCTVVKRETCWSPTFLIPSLWICFLCVIPRVLRVSLLSVRLLPCLTSRELYTCVFQCMFTFTFVVCSRWVPAIATYRFLFLPPVPHICYGSPWNRAFSVRVPVIPHMFPV